MEQSFRSKVADAGRIVIPAEFRKAFELREGEEVVFTRDAESIRITPLKRAIELAQNLFTSLAPADVVMSNELIRDRRDEEASE
jgi:AbrB family looped-hinge helix DNA binding protein